MLLTVNIRKYLVGQPRTKRARKAVMYVRDRIAHFTKTEVENVRIDQELNRVIVKKYSKSMTPVRMNIKIEDGKALAEPLTQDKLRASDTAKNKDKGQQAEEKGDSSKKQ